MLGIVQQINDKEKTRIWRRGLINLSIIRRYGSEYQTLNAEQRANRWLCWEPYKHRNTVGQNAILLHFTLAVHTLTTEL